MNHRIAAAAAVVATSLSLVLLAASPASATTICVPTFDPATCPNTGGNLEKAELEDAMNTNSNDGIADRINIAAGTFTDTGSFRTNGTQTDKLEIIGAGQGKTVLTSSSVTGTAVMNLPGTATRVVDVSNLTIVIPASMPDSEGLALQSKGGLLQDVEIDSRNPGSDGVALTGSVVASRVKFHGTAGGSLDDAIRLNETIPGAFTAERMTIQDSANGLIADQADVPVRVFDSFIDSAKEAAVVVADGADVEMQNLVVDADSPQAFVITADHDPPISDSDVRFESSTIFGSSPASGTGILSKVLSFPNSGDTEVVVKNSIIRGFEFTWDQPVPIGPGFGISALTLTDSNFPMTFPESSTGSATVSDPGNINADPKFAGPADFRLTEGSPSIDAADPASPIAIDIEGRGRPQDGDRDGIKINDQGAYEFEPAPASCLTDPALCPKDKVAPKITKVKFKSPKGKKKGSLKLSLSEQAKIKAAFKPVPKGKGRKKRKTVTLNKPGKKGANSLAIKKGKLKRGKYRVIVTATDAAGNRSKAITKMVKVK